MLRRVRPRLVTFDVNGTLFNTDLEKHYTEIASQHGVTVSNSRKLAASFEKNLTRMSEEHPIFGKQTGIGWKNWWREIVWNVFKDQDQGISDEKLEKVANSLMECYGTSRCWEKFSGAHEILECLKERGLILGVISNFDDRLGSILESLELRSYFTFVLTSYGFGREKPDPLIFEEALRIARLSRGITVAPEEAVHIGDTFKTDYQGAKNARWTPFFVNHKGKRLDETQVPSVHQFANLAQLQTHLETELDRKEITNYA